MTKTTTKKPSKVVKPKKPKETKPKAVKPKREKSSVVKGAEEALVLARLDPATDADENPVQGRHSFIELVLLGVIVYFLTGAVLFAVNTFLL